jgi:hypothetical protein
LESAKEYTDSAVSQKSQVQMITSDTTEVLSTLKIHRMTQEQYDQALANGTLDDNALYLTPDDNSDLGDYVTIEQLNNKADIVHSHNDIYYTETEIDDLLDETANTIKNDLLNGAGTAYDTLKELGDLIDDNVDAIEALETVASGKADADHIHNDIYYTETEIDDKISAINTSIATSLNQAKSHSDTNLNTAKTYADNIVAQKSQVQIVTWEDDD